jgi:hypothetical protein
VPPLRRAAAGRARLRGACGEMSSSCCQRSAPLGLKLRAALETRLGALAQELLEDPALGLARVGPLALFDAAGGAVGAVAERVAGAGAGTGAGPPGAEQQLLLAPGQALGRAHDSAAAEAAALLHVIGALRVACSRFAATLQISECPVVHLKGGTQLFSCYTVGARAQHVLAVYASPRGADLEAFDTALIDAVLEPRIEDLASDLAGITLKPL